MLIVINGSRAINFDKVKSAVCSGGRIYFDEAEPIVFKTVQEAQNTFDDIVAAYDRCESVWRVMTEDFDNEN